MSRGTFLYFAYGSNLLAKRIHIQNPTAIFLDTAKLDNHRIDFIRVSNRWNGASATIVPAEGEYVWGALWEISNENSDSLDDQEGVNTNFYFVKNVTVTRRNGEFTLCRTYEQCMRPILIKAGETIPEDRLPSKTYMETIVNGAKQIGLPNDYITMLENIKHNGKNASQVIIDQLQN